MSTETNANRIAELSAQLCVRLSYAAAKVERDWEFDPNEGKYVFSRRASLSSSPKAVRRTPKQTTKSPKVEKSTSPRQRHVNGARIREMLEMGQGTVSLGTSSSNGAMETCQKHSSASSVSHHPVDSKDQIISLDMAQIPRLEPPANIVSGAFNNPRQRPNPNDTRSIYSSCATFSPNKKPALTHQSSTSSLDDINSPTSVIPGTPSQPQFPCLSSTPLNSIHPLAKLRTPSQNALMEQDAIETLLFMSSPENSGYYPGSQHQPKQPIPRSANITPLLSAFGSESVSNASALEPEGDMDPRSTKQRTTHIHRSNYASQGRYERSHNFRGAGLEHEAGDEIDRMLDEMVDSDEDLELNWLSNHEARAAMPQNGPDPGTLLEPPPEVQP
ncbi:hypothetical protein D8B26_000462 [Coccidioides posadasii str. Silveira]|uniref:Uncharacterized protein n=1 Tax=Coccidioides posadasii (strain RMSCC 757 / Silveira) TaxID=443226 RepID=E9DFN0_COCPS|nr:conserved hypothetical protein [Coccidioides posadasii str. Silveira]QVM05753.1 hypothetical protein D8B26_000462 [Coccidioides posadasii str. Silveira]